MKQFLATNKKKRNGKEVMKLICRSNRFDNLLLSVEIILDHLVWCRSGLFHLIVIDEQRRLLRCEKKGQAIFEVSDKNGQFSLWLTQMTLKLSSKACFLFAQFVFNWNFIFSNETEQFVRKPYFYGWFFFAIKMTIEVGLNETIFSFFYLSFCS